MENTMTFAEMMKDEKVQEGVENLKAKLAEDTAVKKLVEAAETVEDMYEIAKRYVQVKLEDFKRIYQEVKDYYSSAKAIIQDEVLDNVAGGRGWNFVGWNKLTCICGCIVGAAIAVVGVGIGATVAILGGPIATVAGVALGVGSVVAGGTIIKENIEKMKNM